jgi:hypothetical protein
MQMDPERLAMLERFAFGRNGKPLGPALCAVRLRWAGQCH